MTEQQRRISANEGKEMAPSERAIRNDELAHQRMFGRTIRQIAKRHGLSNSLVHRLVKDVAIVCGDRRQKPEKPLYSFELVPLPDAGFFSSTAWLHCPDLAT